VPGGFDDNAPLDCVEQYDPIKNIWTTVASTATPRGGVGVATLCGRLYAVGGHDGSNYLDTVEAYDPAINWFD
jgi:kelch-like protein 8